MLFHTFARSTRHHVDDHACVVNTTHLGRGTRKARLRRSQAFHGQSANQDRLIMWLTLVSLLTLRAKRAFSVKPFLPDFCCCHVQDGDYTEREKQWAR